VGGGRSAAPKFTDSASCSQHNGQVELVQLSLYSSYRMATHPVVED